VDWIHVAQESETSTAAVITGWTAGGRDVRCTVKLTLCQLLAKWRLCLR
jgi:hypothetical protein